MTNNVFPGPDFPAGRLLWIALPDQPRSGQTIDVGIPVIFIKG